MCFKIMHRAIVSALENKNPNNYVLENHATILRALLKMKVPVIKCLKTMHINFASALENKKPIGFFFEINARTLGALLKGKC